MPTVCIVSTCQWLPQWLGLFPCRVWDSTWDSTWLTWANWANMRTIVATFLGLCNDPIRYPNLLNLVPYDISSNREKQHDEPLDFQINHLSASFLRKKHRGYGKYDPPPGRRRPFTAAHRCLDQPSGEPWVVDDTRDEGMVFYLWLRPLVLAWKIWSWMT